MDVHTRSADIPVMLSNHVKTIPSPHIVVRKVRNENASERLRYYVRVVEFYKDLRELTATKGWAHLDGLPIQIRAARSLPGRGIRASVN
jgi:hypothetical protein